MDFDEMLVQARSIAHGAEMISLWAGLLVSNMEQFASSVPEIFQGEIETLPASGKCHNQLRRAGIATIFQLVQLQERELLRKKNIGPVLLAEVKGGLAKLGLRLGMNLASINNFRPPEGSSE